VRKTARLFVFAWISSVNGFARSAIFREERMHLAVTGEFAAVCLRDTVLDTVLDILDSPGFSLSIIEPSLPGDRHSLRYRY
jgi:hypothetical protein